MTSMCVEGVCRDPDEVGLRDDQRPAGFDMLRPHLSDFRPSHYSSGDGHNQRRSTMG